MLNADVPRRVTGFHRLPRHVVRYGAVGGTCTLLQLAVLHLGVRVTGLAPEGVNAVAFLLSTQLNFVLSDRFTWAHRRVPAVARARSTAWRLLAFNLAALFGLAVNSVAFSAAHRLAELPVLAAGLLAVACSTAAGFLISSRVVFRAHPLATGHTDILTRSEPT